MFKSVISFLVLLSAGWQVGFAQSGGTGVLSDEVLFEKVQKQTFAYFWDFAHPVSGLSRERSNASFGYGDEVFTTEDPDLG